MAKPVVQGGVKMIRYVVIKETRHAPDIGEYASFGIQALTKTPDGWELADRLSDISPDPAAVEALACRCNKARLALVHLSDVVEDFLNG